MLQVIDRPRESEDTLRRNLAKVTAALGRGEKVRIYHMGKVHGRLANLPGVEYKDLCAHKKDVPVSPQALGLYGRLTVLHNYHTPWDGGLHGEMFIHWFYRDRKKDRLSRCEIFHLNMLQYFNVMDRVEAIHIRCAANEPMTAAMGTAVRILSGGKAKVDFRIVPQRGSWEYDTFKECAEYASETGKFVYYTHFKGVSRIEDAELGLDGKQVRNSCPLDILYWCYLMYRCLFMAPAGVKAIGPIRTNNARLLKVYSDNSWTRIAKDKQDFFYRGSFQGFSGTALNANLKDLGVSLDKTLPVGTHTVEMWLSAIFRSGDIYSLPATAQSMNTPGYHEWTRQVFPGFHQEFNSLYGGAPTIIAAMTSWEKRIGNVATVARTLLDQDTPLNGIELNLARPCFPGGEASLPSDLRELVDAGKVSLHWVEKDTYTFKKIMPSIRRHMNENCVILSCDDDILYGRGYVSSIMRLLGDNDVACADRGYVGFKAAVRVWAFSPDFWERLTDEVINYRVNDSYIQAYLSRRRAACVYLKDPAVLSQLKDYNPVCPNSSLADGYSHEHLCKVNEAVNRALDAP